MLNSFIKVIKRLIENVFMYTTVLDYRFDFKVTVKIFIVSQQIKDKKTVLLHFNIIVLY